LDQRLASEQMKVLFTDIVVAAGRNDAAMTSYSRPARTSQEDPRVV
jgi:hypothetical protein